MKNTSRNKTKKILNYFSNKLKQNSTKAEQAFKKILTQMNIPFEEQKVFNPNEEIKYILDFFLPSYNICVEIDGGYHKLNSTSVKDKRRDKTLEAYGIKTIRFSNKDVFNDQASVIIKLFDKIENKK